MKKVILVLILMLFSGCGIKQSTKIHNDKDLKNQSNLNTTLSLNKKSTVKHSTNLDTPHNEKMTLPQKSSSHNNTSSVKRVYNCSELSKATAYSLLQQGHTYLDRDGDGHPCEWDKKSITSYSTPSYKSNYVRGYYRKDGTYVRGHYRKSRGKSYRRSYRRSRR